jgi:ABC-type amino acid transport substrate-binding protein
MRPIDRFFQLFLAILLCCVLQTQAQAVTTVIYPDSEEKGDPRFNDLIEILKTALEKTVPEFGMFTMRASNIQANGLRYLNNLKTGNDLNVLWSSTSEEKENTYLPIRIPLRKGLLGYRVALISKDKQALVDQVKTLDDLKKLTIGQGVGWDDVKLYEANGIDVIQAKYSNLFRMLSYGRFELFPRGIGEVLTEFAQHKDENPKLAIEQNLLLYYPWPYYFFFNKKDKSLQQRVELGLRKMLKDGSFDAIFLKYNGKAIEALNFKQRRIIRMENYLLPKKTPLNDATLWFHPKMN